MPACAFDGVAWAGNEANGCRWRSVAIVKPCRTSGDEVSRSQRRAQWFELRGVMAPLIEAARVD